jgi:hypothetical protein
MDKMLAGEIKKALEADVKSTSYASYGLRALTRDQLSLSVGDILPPSRDYVEDHETTESLAGSSAIGLDVLGGEIDADDVDKAMTLVAKYSGDVVALVAGHFAGNGEDMGEILISDAGIIALYTK